MPSKKFAALKDEEIVRVAKAEVIMSAAAAYTETELDTQLSIERGVIWLINAIEFYIGRASIDDLIEVAAGLSESISLQLTRESKSAILDPDDADLLQNYEIACSRSAAIGTDAGPLYYITHHPVPYLYNPPLPYAGQSLYFAADSTSASAVTAYCRIRYTIRSVSDKYFFRVAQALLG